MTLALACALVVAACSSGEDESGSGGGGASQITYQTVSGEAGNTALHETILDGFTDETGIKVKTDYFCCGNSKLKAQVENKQVTWDIVNLGSAADLVLAGENDLLEKIDYSIVDKDLMLPDAASEYGIQGRTFAAAIAWNSEKFPESGPQPTSTTDIFDTKDFPGKRCMYKHADFGGTLEIALMADGVPRDQVYPIDTDRALAKLDTIKKDIVWWESGEQVQNLLRSGECDIAIVWHGSVVTLAQEKQPIAMAWGDAVLYHDYLGIPKGAKNVKEANELLNWLLTDKEGQIAMVKRYPYPMLAIKGIEAADYGPEIAPYIPVGDNVKTALALDGAYMATAIEDLQKAMSSWLAS